MNLPRFSKYQFSKNPEENVTLARILQDLPCLPEFSKIGNFCKILQDSVSITHYLPSSCKNLTRILKEMHFISTWAIKPKISKAAFSCLTLRGLSLEKNHVTEF